MNIYIEIYIYIHVKWCFYKNINNKTILKKNHNSISLAMKSSSHAASVLAMFGLLPVSP